MCVCGGGACLLCLLYIPMVSQHGSLLSCAVLLADTVSCAVLLADTVSCAVLLADSELCSAVG